MLSFFGYLFLVSLLIKWKSVRCAFHSLNVQLVCYREKAVFCFPASFERRRHVAGPAGIIDRAATAKATVTATIVIGD